MQETAICRPVCWIAAEPRCNFGRKEDRSKGDDGDPYGGLPEGAVVDSEGVIDLTGVGAGSGNRST